MDPHNPGGPGAPFPGQFLPPNFDINRLPPAEREALLRRLQQHQQMQRARAQQSAPRPPFAPGMPQQMPRPMHPSYMAPGQAGPFLRPPPHTMNPQQYFVPPPQFGYPPMAPPEAQPQFVRPAMISPNTTASAVQSLTPLDESVLSSEGAFTEHLIRFLEAFKFPNRRIPQLGGRPIPLFRLFQLVNGAGGFLAIGEGRKWPQVTAALQLPAQNLEVVTSIRNTYLTFLYPYEQFFIQKRPADKIECKQIESENTYFLGPTLTVAAPQVPNPPPASTQLPASQPSIQVPKNPAMSIPPPPPSVPQPQPAPPVLFIPDSDLAAWKPYASTLCTLPVNVMDIDTITLFLGNPSFALRFEGLLMLHKLLTLPINNSKQNALPATAIPSLISSLESIWSSCRRDEECDSWTFESLLAAEDLRKRDLMADHNPKQELLLLQQVSLSLRLLVVTRPEHSALLASIPFIANILHWGMLECSDYEIKKNLLVLFEGVSTYLEVSKTTVALYSWSIGQATRELDQTMRERLLGPAARLVASMNISKLDDFESLNAARQTVSLLIAQVGQLYRLVPAHIFPLLSGALHVLSNKAFDHHTESEAVLAAFAKELERFVGLFVLPCCAMLRSLRALLLMVIREAQEIEIGKLCDSAIYSPAFNLADGGFVELCLQILSKCLSKYPSIGENLRVSPIVLLVEELRMFWSHPETNSSLSKSCFATVMPSANNTSPSKRSRMSQMPILTNDLAITKGAAGITTMFSHPFMVLQRSLEVLVSAYSHLDFETQLRLHELAVTWSVDAGSSHGKQVLNCERLESSLAVLRDRIYGDLSRSS